MTPGAPLPGLGKRLLRERLSRTCEAALGAHRVRMQEASTALMRRERKPPLSRTCKAWMVAPPGEQTLSLSWPGCFSESSSILEAPYSQSEQLTAAGRLSGLQASAPSPGPRAPTDSPPIHPHCNSIRPGKEWLPPEDQEKH